MLKIEQHVPLAPLTNIKLGGTAAYFATCYTVEDIQEALGFAREHSLSVHVLAGGSNTVFPDEELQALVIHIALRGISRQDEEDSVTFRIAAGEDWDPFVKEVVAEGLAGVECLSGIPGSVGATPIQNVGAYGQEVVDTIVEVSTIERSSGQITVFTNEECRFGYRTSRFKQEDKNRYIITDVVFRLARQGEPALVYQQLKEVYESFMKNHPPQSLQEELSLVRQAVLSLRSKKSMVVREDDPHSRSCGSFFMNPHLAPAEFQNLQTRAIELHILDPIPHFPAGNLIDVPAAWLIEHAGFTKGLRHGGVGISVNHPLALVNYGGTTKELLELKTLIQDKVEETFGIHLSPEPIIVSST